VIPAEAARRPSALAPKLVAEVHDLHDRAESLERDAGIVRNRKLRRELRNTRQAEADLLRVLGYISYDDFVAATTRAFTDLARPAAECEAPGTGSEDLRSIVPISGATHDPTLLIARDSARFDAIVTELRERVAIFEQQAAQVRVELGEMREELARVAEQPPPSAASVPVDLHTAFVEALTELRALAGVLREDRIETTARSEAAVVEAESMLARARVEAERILRDARTAAAEAVEHGQSESRALLEAASAEARAMIRNARVTADGVTRLADFD
jgi:cell division septum initiation protein DivIVA